MPVASLIVTPVIENCVASACAIWVVVEPTARFEVECWTPPIVAVQTSPVCEVAGPAGASAIVPVHLSAGEPAIVAPAAVAERLTATDSVNVALSSLTT